MIPNVLLEELFRAFHEPAHHGYEATPRRIAQRFWWFLVRSDVSACVKACEVCDRDRHANPTARTALNNLSADQPFGVLYIDIVGIQGSLSWALTEFDSNNGGRAHRLGRGRSDR